MATPTKPRFDVAIAGLVALSALIAPGFAQGLMRQRVAQWIVFGAVAASLVATALTPWALVLALAIWVGAIVDAVLRYAKHRGQIRWSWLDPLLAFFASIVMSLGVRVFVIEAFKIPSSAMYPTLQIGDHLFISKLRSFERGAVIVFIKPCEPDRDYVKRVVGLENDSVEVRCGIVYINGTAVPSTLVAAEDSYLDRPEGDSQWEQRIVSRYREQIGEHVFDIFHLQDQPERQQRGEPDPTRDFPRDKPPICSNNPELTENQLPGTIVTTGEASGCKPFRHYVVPPGHVFVMGDNRDNSNDSRFWGSVPVANIKGPASVIWYPFGRIGRVN